MTKTKMFFEREPRPKKNAERIRIKPPTKKNNNYPLTFEVRSQIHKLSLDLPQVPYFMIGPDGTAKIQQTTKTEFKGQSGMAGKRVNNFVKGKETRQMNHKVTLNQQYQLRGQAGIDDYVKYVVDLHNNLMSMSQALNNITEEPKVVGASLESTDVLPDMPEPTNYGFQPNADNTGWIWAVEGGEQSYNKAMAEYEERKAHYSKPTEINNDIAI